MSGEFLIRPTTITAVKIIEPIFHYDERGAFAEIFKVSELSLAGIDLKIKQINYSESKAGVIRGMHYQLKPRAQGKMVRVITGEIFDVAADIRKESPTYGEWVGEILSGSNHQMIYVPPGFAHGFAVRSEQAEVIYYCDEEYAPKLERGIAWDDAVIGIKWGIDKPVMSEKDKRWPKLAEAEINF